MRLIISFIFIMSFSFQTKAQSFEIITVDTLNRIDIHNQKQGKWEIRGIHILKQGHTRYKPDQKIEEGMYLNNRKEWIWIEYYPNGKRRNLLTYKHGILDGHAVFYNTDGKILKEGKFKGNKWVN